MRPTPGGAPDLGLEGWAHVDRVVDDVQLSDLPVGPELATSTTSNGAAAPEGKRQSKWNQKLTVVWPAWSVPLITDLNVRFA